MSDANGCRRVLCVDDEANVLAGLERTLYEHFDVFTAGGGAAGLEVLESDGPFAVVVSDMRMPEMDGAAFLSRVRNTYPHTVRILLTGQTELDSAIAAVNEGNIFRFLCKPCPQETLLHSLETAAEQYRLITAERDLLENTLKGSVKVLTEILSLTSPIAFSRAGQIKAYVAHMAQRLGVEDQWQYEMAAMLAQLGCITLPSEILGKVYTGQAIAADEQQMFDEHPDIGHKLLAHIPRLEAVAAMIRNQRGTANADAAPDERLGGQMLQAALAVDRLVATGTKVGIAVAQLKENGGLEPELLDALTDFKAYEQTQTIKALSVKQLRAGMVLDEDVRTKKGTVVISKGEELHGAYIARLANFARGIGIEEPIRVCVPASPQIH